MTFKYRYIVETPVCPQIIASTAQSIAGKLFGKKGVRWTVAAGARGLLFSFATQADLLKFIGCWNKAAAAKPVSCGRAAR